MRRGRMEDLIIPAGAVVEEVVGVEAGGDMGFRAVPGEGCPAARDRDDWGISFEDEVWIDIRQNAGSRCIASSVRTVGLHALDGLHATTIASTWVARLMSAHLRLHLRRRHNTSKSPWAGNRWLWRKIGMGVDWATPDYLLSTDCHMRCN